MKHLFEMIVLSTGVLLCSCVNSRAPNMPVSSMETGTIKLAVNLNEPGSFGTMTDTNGIDLVFLAITVSTDKQDIILDTLDLTGGSHARTERKTYSDLAVQTDQIPVEWTLLARTLDRNREVIHSGDTTFVVPPNDTAEISLFLDARYSMLVANYFPIPDSATRCELLLDGKMVTEYRFPQETSVGDTVTLRYNYLKASPVGESHRIETSIYGNMVENNRLLYTEDTTVVVKSGEEASYAMTLDYVGPNTQDQPLTIFVTLGGSGTTRVDGIVPHINHFLTVTSSGNGSVSMSDSVIHDIPYTIKATADPGNYFTIWRVVSGTVQITDSTNPVTSVLLKEDDATIQAVFIEGNTFQKQYSFSTNDWGVAALQTADSGYFILGISDFSSPDLQIRLIKTDMHGIIRTTKTFDIGDEEYCTSLQPTNDAGYIIAGNNYDYETRYKSIFLMKTNEDGDSLWTKIFGNATIIDNRNGMQQTSDGGYIILGITESTRSDGTVLWDVYLIKTNEDGDSLWTKAFGGTEYYQSNAIQQTTDGGYIIVGKTNFSNIDGSKIYLIKTDENGDSLWTKTYGDTRCNTGYSVIQTTDGGYIVAGVTDCQSSYLHLIRTNEDGETLWTKTFKTITHLSIRAIESVIDGGFIISGTTCWIKIDNDGDMVWSRSLNVSINSYNFSTKQDMDGGYYIIGSIDGKKNLEISFIKTDENGYYDR